MHAGAAIAHLHILKFNDRFVGVYRHELLHKVVGPSDGFHFGEGAVVDFHVPVHSVQILQEPLVRTILNGQQEL